MNKQLPNRNELSKAPPPRIKGFSLNARQKTTPSDLFIGGGGGGKGGSRYVPPHLRGKPIEDQGNGGGGGGPPPQDQQGRDFSGGRDRDFDRERGEEEKHQRKLNRTTKL